MYLKVQSFSNGKPILFGMNAARTPFSVALNASDIQFDAENRRTLPEGTFIAKIGSSVRPLPRTRTNAAVATNSAAVQLKVPNTAFKVGDVLRAVACQASVVLSGTPVEGDIVTVRVDNVNYSVTVDHPDDSPTLGFVATQIAALVIPGVTLTAIGSSVLFTGTDSYKLTVHSSSPALITTVYSTDPGYLGANILPLGTIASIGAPDSQNRRTVTLAANAAYALPVNTPVGVEYSKLLGIYPDPLDFTEDPVIHIAPVFHCDGVYENNLPYCDKEIKRVLHGLNINSKFFN